MYENYGRAAFFSGVADVNLLAIDVGQAYAIETLGCVGDFESARIVAAL